MSILSKIGGGDRYFDDLLARYGLDPKKITRNKDGSIDYDGSVSFYKRDITKIPFKFNKVNGYFDCSACEKLIYLEGCPKEVGGSFYCYDCKNLLSLEGGPKKVERNFDCSECKNLTSLKGSPEKVGWYFYCQNCGRKFTEEEVKEYCNVKKTIYT